MSKKQAETAAAAVVTVAVENKTEAKVRTAKIYQISAGKLPEANQKALGAHAVTITKAINKLVQDGKSTATREEIMKIAVELGLFTDKPTVQKEPAIFAWWRKPLSDLGWLKY